MYEILFFGVRFPRAATSQSARYYIGLDKLTNSTVSGNSALVGGGIFNSGNLTLANSTVSGNSDLDTSALDNSGLSIGGGGIFNRGTLNLINSTVADNSANYGGGISNVGGTITLVFCTLYNNSASRNGGGLFTKDDTSFGELMPGTSTILNSMIAGNHASQGPDIAGNLTTQGYNLIQTKGSVIPDHKHLLDFINIPGSQIKVDPNLQLNGSTTTKTHALLPGSLAIDAIPRAACLVTVNGVTITTDQRGIKRPQGSACDIGAYEYAP
jgi:hypothetical protein